MHLPGFTTRPAEGLSRRSRSVSVIAGYLLVVVAAVLRFYHIETQSLWVDEGFTLRYSDTQSIATTLRLLLESSGTERFSPLSILFSCMA